MERRNGAQLARLLLNRCDKLGVLMADVHVDQLAREVEIALAVLVPEPTAFGPGDNDWIERALRRPTVEHVTAIVRVCAGRGSIKSCHVSIVFDTDAYVQRAICTRTTFAQLMSRPMVPAAEAYD